MTSGGPIAPATASMVTPRRWCKPSSLSVNFTLRVTAPAGVVAGTQDTTRLQATSSPLAVVTEFASDQTTVISDAKYTNTVILTPDDGGIMQTTRSPTTGTG